MAKLPPHVSSSRNKTGRVYYYFQRGRGSAAAGARVRLPDINDPDFWTQYAICMGATPVAPRTDTFSALIDAWHASPEWASMTPQGRYEWARHCRRIREQWGDLPVRGLEPKHVFAWRDHYADTPATANNQLKCLSALIAWSIPRGWREDNPCRDVPRFPKGAGYAPWPWDVIDAAFKALPDELARAAALALYTGQRKGDVLAMRRNQVRDGAIEVTQEKTGRAVWIPIHRELRPMLAEIPHDAVTVLANLHGRPWTKTAFNTAWRRARPDILRERGLVFHGLRKSAVVTLIEAGCSTAEVAAITGQSLQMVEHYARARDQKRLAIRAMERWENEG